jgi:misacylated tRNA(Ala) deacylase
MTEEIFRDDAYVKSCDAVVTDIVESGIILNRTVFYPEGGGQPGDTGVLRLPDGGAVLITDTRKASGGGGIIHVVRGDAVPVSMGDTVMVELDWNRRYAHMRMHTCLHLLCSLIEGGVTGGSISEAKGRLDFDLPDTALDKEQITEDLNGLIEANHPTAISWITDEKMSEREDIVRTMSVKPPMGQGRVRLLEVNGVDLQPCGGTHVQATGEIGRVRIGKIENKGKHNRRVNVLFDQ